MTEIKLNIEEQYLQAFLEYLKTLTYVSVQEVSGKGRRANGASASETMLQNLSPEDPLRKAVRPLRKAVTAEQLAHEQGYQKTDWKRVEQLAKEMDIQEPIEDLLAQLTA